MPIVFEDEQPAKGSKIVFDDEQPAPQKKAVKLPDATAVDRVQAGASGLNKGIAGLAGLPMDTMLNVTDLAKAGVGYAQSKITGKPPSEMFDPTDRSQVPLSGEFNSRVLNKAGVFTDPNRPDDTASRYIHAGAQGVPGAIVGGAGGGAATMARQLAAGAAPGIGGQAAHDVGLTDTDQASIEAALGVAAGKAAGTPKPPKTVVGRQSPTVTKDFRAIGGKVLPSEEAAVSGNRNYAGRLLEAAGGKENVKKDISMANKTKLTTHAEKAIGAADLTGKGIQGVKDTGNKAYEAMGKLGPMLGDEELTASIEKVRGLAGKSTKRNKLIDSLVDEVASETSDAVDAGQVVNRVRELRKQAALDQAKQVGVATDVQVQAQGDARRQLADVLDNWLERHATASGQPELAKSYKDNRVRLAKTGTVENASRAGKISAKDVYDQGQEGAPINGKLGEIATAHEYFPEATADTGAAQVTDMGGGSLGTLVKAAQTMVGRPLARSILGSDWYQNSFGRERPQSTDYSDVSPAQKFRAPEEPPAAPAVDFDGALGIAPDFGPQQSLPGNVSAQKLTGRQQTGQQRAGEGPAELELAEDARKDRMGGRASGRGFSPDALDFEPPTETQPYQPFTGGERFTPSLNPRTEQPLLGDQFAKAGDLQLTPEPDVYASSSLPPQGDFGAPTQGGSPPTPVGGFGAAGQSAGVNVQPSTRPGYSMVTVGGQKLAEVPQEALGDLLEMLNTTESQYPAQQVGAPGQRAKTDSLTTVPGVQRSVTGYRGVAAGRDPFSTDDTLGNALFFAPDEATAQTYAPPGGQVASRQIDFQNLLDAPTLAAIREALQLGPGAELTDMIGAARGKGYDGMTYDLQPGREYVQIPQRAVR